MKINKCKISSSITGIKSMENGSDSAVGPAKIRKRHVTIKNAFIALTLVPFALVAGYMYLIAGDRYHAETSFTVQSDNNKGGMDLLGGIAQFTGASTNVSDHEILYQYIVSQEIVKNLDDKLNLRSIYSTDWPIDFIYSFPPQGTIEDLHSYWLRNLTINQDNTGILTVKITAPSADSAVALSNAVFELSSDLINRIATSARNDSIDYAHKELLEAESRVNSAREELTSFRIRTHMIDPALDIQSQFGVLSNLQVKLSETMLEIRNLDSITNSNDPRLVRLLQDKESITSLIKDEREKLSTSISDTSGESYPALISDFEKLTANLTFSEASYRAALANYDSVLAQSFRQARYLAAHIQPSVAERALYPKRLFISLMAPLCGMVIWLLGVLVYYSVRDRR